MISIITPAYIDTIEKLEWLNEAVMSVRSQLLADWELILMDDASPMPINLQEPDERIRVLRMVRRSGPSLCRNTAIALARYEAILPLDADDMLPSPGTLNLMLSAWEEDKTKIIYGHIQRLELIDNLWRQAKVIELPDYTFQKSLDLNGIMPVTAMHSKECHIRAGGWKGELEAGLEDVEYWIAAGKAGFCGRKVDDVTLLYRKHDESRSSQLRRVNRRETEMRNRIREMHEDVYRGVYPMGCCGGGRPYVPPESMQASSVSMPTTLDQFSSSDKVWVEYNGQREASFGMVGPFTNISYIVDGLGHKLEVHINDLPKFRHSGRGLDFKVGVAPPNGHALVQPKISGEVPAFEIHAPELAQILQLDEVALAT